VGFNGIMLHQLQANWTPNGNPAGTLYLAILSTASFPSANGLSGNQSSTTANTSMTFSGLSINTRYYADVAVLNSISNSAFVSMGPVATLANPPAPLAPTNIQSNQITANWGDNGNPAGTFYLVQASVNPGFSSIAASVSTTSLSSTLTGLAGITTYYMQVQAVNLDNIPTSFTPLPSTATLNNPAAPPGAAGLTNVTALQLQANWTTNGNPAGTTYTAVLSSGPSPSTNGYAGNQSSSTLNTSVIFAGLSPDTFYYVEVKATNSNGSSPYTNLGFLPTLANPPTPANPSAIGPDSITANWGPNGNPADTVYLVQIGLSTTSFIDTEATISTNFAFTGLSGNTTYYMQVKAINRLAQSTPYIVLPATQTVVGTPGIPVLSVLQITDSSITWQWTTVLNAAQYHLVDESGLLASPILSPSTLQFQDTNYPVDTGLIPNTLYQRSVVAVNTVGIASTSTLVQAVTWARQPAGLSAEYVYSSSITISWHASGNPSYTQYTAQISPAPLSGPGIQTVQGPNDLIEATFQNLAGATTYFFTVTALNGVGIAAPAGNVLSVATLPQQFASGQICPYAAGAIAFNGPNGQVRVDIPSGAFSSCIQMAVTIPGSGDFPDAPSSGTPLQGTGVGVQLGNDLSLEPNIPLTLYVPFTNAEVSNGQRNQLVLARYDTAHNAWVMVRSAVDPGQNIVTAQIDHLSVYQIMVALPSSNLANVRVYPNPLRPALGHQGVHFVNLPADATIDLFTLTGDKVQSLSAEATGTAFWDGRNQAGRSAASGVYFAVVKSGGEKTILKVAVQR